MIKHLMEQRSEAWHNIRLTRITGTGFKDLMASKTTAAYQNLIANIVAQIITGKSNEAGYINEAMQNGIDTEPIAANYYEELFDCKLEEVGFVTPDESNKYHEWVGVSPDRLTEDGGIVEIKCPFASTHLYYLMNPGKLPSTYKWQVYGQLFVTGAKYCDFFSFVPDMKPFILRVYPDESIFNEIEKELDIFIPKVNELLTAYNKYEFI